MGEMGQFWMASLRKLGTPSGDQASQSPEVRALLRLQELGIQKVYGEAIAGLLSLAKKRAQAKEQLSCAEHTLRQALSDKGQIEAAFREAEHAFKILQQIEYPDKPDFAFRRLALQADSARAQALQETINMWWWQRFLETAIEFNQRLSLPPSEKSFSDARQTLQKARDLHDSWPESESRWRQQASKALTEMNNRLEEARQNHRHVLLKEAGYWLGRTEAYLPTEPFAALSCLNHARMILGSLKAGRRVELMPPDVQHAQQRLDDLWRRASTHLVQHLAGQRQDDFLRTVKELDRQWKEWSSRLESQRSVALDQEANLQKFIRDQDNRTKARRALLDKIRLHIYLNPAAKAADAAQDDWLKKLVLMRHDDLLQAQQLLQDVESWWNLGEAERRRCIYWAWQQINKAFERNPDSAEVSSLRDQVQMHWKETIAQEWADPAADILQLIPSAKSFLNQPEISDAIKTHLRKSIQARWAEWSAVPPSHVLSAYQELGLGEVRP